MREFNAPEMIKSSFVVCSMISWVKGIYHLVIDNHFQVGISSFLITGTFTINEILFQESIFGTTYFVLLLVLGTVLFNTGTGIKKSLMMSQEYYEEAQKFEHKSFRHRVKMKQYQSHKFDIQRLSFVFFKFFSFMAYLLVAKQLTSENVGDSAGIEMKALYLTTEILIRVPIAFFWYYEFKSIGENSEYIFNKKASIFTIVENIFEPRISKIFGNKTPSDGKQNEENKN